jgi:hypothetical protein
MSKSWFLSNEGIITQQKWYQEVKRIYKECIKNPIADSIDMFDKSGRGNMNTQRYVKL